MQGLAFALLALSPGGCSSSQDLGLDGLYEVKSPASSNRQGLVIQGRQWILFDTMSGILGTVDRSGEKVTLTVLETPMGRLGTPELLEFSLDASGQLTEIHKPARRDRYVFARTSQPPPLRYSDGQWQ